MTVPKIEIAKDALTVSRFIYGIWRMHEDKDGVSTKRIIEKIEACLAVGIDSFDHADIYGNFNNEELFGKALAEKPILKSKIKLVTKCGIQIPGNKFTVKHYNTSKDHIRYSVERSLKKLQVDRLDLVLIHRPDPLMNPSEMAQVFESLIQEGKVSHFGVSNFTNSQFQLLQSKFSKKLVTNQVEFSPLHTEPLFDGTFDLSIIEGFSPMVWSPTAGGRIFNPKSEREFAVKQKIEEIANRYSCNPDQILYSWFLNHPAKLIPILGTNDIKRVISASKAFSYPISRTEWFEILEAGRGKEVA